MASRSLSSAARHSAKSNNTLSNLNSLNSQRNGQKQADSLLSSFFAGPRLAPGSRGTRRLNSVRYTSFGF